MSEDKKNETTVLYQQFLLRFPGDEIRITFSDNYDLILIDKQKNKHYFIKHPKIEGHFIYDGWSSFEMKKEEPPLYDKEEFESTLKTVVKHLLKPGDEKN